MAFRFATPIVVSFGEETFFLDRDFNQFCAQPQYTVVTLDGSDLSDGELISTCSTFSVDLDDPSSTKSRVVVVDDAHKLKAGKELKTYLEQKPSDEYDCILALVFRSEKLPSFWSKLGSKVTFREHKKLKTWDNNNEVVRWVQEEAKRLKLSLDAKMAWGMFQLAGDDLYRLASELRKLVLLVGPGVPITIEHLKLVLSPGTTAEPWTVAEAAFGKSPQKAINLLSLLYRYSSDDPSIPVMGAMMRQAEKLLLVRSMLDRNASHEEIAGRLGMHPYRFKMSLLPQVGKHTQRELVRAMRNLCKLDVDLKSTSRSRRTLLELVVIGLAS